MLNPFRNLIGFNLNSLNLNSDGDYNTGAKYINGKYIYRKTIDIQQVSTYIPDYHDEDFIKIEGMYSEDGTTYIPLKIASINKTTGITLDGQTISGTATGFCTLEYTENIENENTMRNFVVTMLILMFSFISYISYDKDSIKEVGEYISSTFYNIYK